MADPKHQTLPPSTFVNFLSVTNTAGGEFYFDFGQTTRGEEGTAHLAVSLVTTAMAAKAMLQALTKNIEKYEKKYGAIPKLPTAQEIES